MPLETETYNVYDELERITSELEDIAAELAQYDPETNRFAYVEHNGQMLDNQRQGLEWFINEYDTDEVTLGNLSSGETAHAHSVTPDDAGDQGVKNVFVGFGTVEAPYRNDDPEDTALTVVEEVDAGFVQWAYSRITSLGYVGDTGNSTSWRTLRQDALTSGD